MQENKNSTDGILDLGIAVFLLAVVGLLATNVFIMYSAQRFNDQSCKLVTLAAVHAALDGQDQKGIVLAAQRELFSCGSGGFFISAPQLQYFTHDKVGNKHKIKVATETTARFPFPILVWESDRSPVLTFKRIYVMEAGERRESSNQSVPR